MLIGLGNKKPVAANEDSADIFAVSTKEFDTKIVAESQNRPILIDFWASWCGPCKQLMPVLQDVVTAQDGKIALAKVDIDANPELAQAFRVQSVPTVIAFYMGQPVAAFQGVRPKSEIENMVQQLIQLQKSQAPDALDIPAVLAEAALAMQESNFPLAENLYAEVLTEDSQNAQALAGIIRILIAQKDFERAQALIQSFPDGVKKNADIGSAITALNLAMAAPKEGVEELGRKISDDPESLYVYAEACFAANDKEKAVDSLISILSKHKGWEDDKARKQLIKYFEAWGMADPASMAGRRKLSSLLFS